MAAERRASLGRLSAQHPCIEPQQHVLLELETSKLVYQSMECVKLIYWSIPLVAEAERIRNSGSDFAQCLSKPEGTSLHAALSP